MAAEYGHGRRYAIDMDRPVEMRCLGTNRNGETDVIEHRYTDKVGEPWRDAQGNPVTEQTLQTPTQHRYKD
jgi:hypothetical protein